MMLKNWSMKNSSSSKKLLYLVTDVSSANVFGLVQLRYLWLKGYEIHLVCGTGYLHSDLTKFCSSIIQVKQLSRDIYLINDLISIFLLIRFFKRIKPSIAIYSTPKAALLGSVCARLTSTPIRIYQIWGARWQTLQGVKEKFVKAMDMITLTNSTHLISVSNSILELYKGVSKKENYVLGKGSAIGVDCKVFSYSSLPISHSYPIIGYAGRFAKDKGLEDLIRIFEQISQRRGLILEIVGDQDYSDPISQEVIDRIQNNPKIRWIKNLNRNELAERMRVWQAQIFLSKREGLGNVILEAGACGVPTFCWKIVGTIDAIPEFAKNFLVEVYNEEMLIERIEKYLENPFSEIEKINYSTWYINNFDQELVLRNFYEYIEAILVK